MKLFEVKEERGFKVYRILGIKFSIREKKYKISDLKKEIDMLRKIIDTCIDITKIPPAKGELRDIQIECTKLLKRFSEICVENNLTYWLDSGTLLGAVRHKGFVPWDDDVDTCMLREDYDKVLPILKKEFENSDFYVRERALTVNYFQIRIMSKKDERIGIDVFPVDRYYKPCYSVEEKRELTEKTHKATRIFEKKYKKVKFNSDLIGQAKADLLRIQSDIVLENRNIETETPALFYGIDYPHLNFENIVYDYESIFPLKEIEFEGAVYTCPNNYDAYLTTLYGDYMKLPDRVSYE